MKGIIFLKEKYLKIQDIARVEGNGNSDSLVEEGW